MTLKVTSSNIQILNSTGVTKFTSSDKLLYQRFYQEGSLIVGSSQVSVPFTTIGTKDVLILTLRINSSTGYSSGIDPLIGLDMPANGNIIIDFYGRLSGTTPIADTEHLGADVIGSNLVFRSIRYGYNKYIGPGAISTNLTYKAKVLSYL